MELLDVSGSVAGSGHEQETVLVHCSEAGTVLQPGVYMSVLGRAVFQEGHGMRQLAGSGLQAELGAGSGSGSGSGVVLQAEQAVAGLLQDSHLMTELVPGLWLVVPGSGVIVYSVFVPLSLLL